MNRLIIVTGGAGFIGSNLVAALNARGEYNIVIVDQLLDDERWRNLVGLRFEDFINKNDFRAMLRENRFGPVETVFHLGACSSTTERNADFLVENNYRYTRELCEWCLRRSVRFIYASSAATYGDGSLGYSDDDQVTWRLRPLNMYGYSKQMFDLWALKNDLFKSIAGLKYFNVFGPREDHKGDMMSVVAKSFHQIQKTGKVRLFKSYRPEYADGEQKRDFVYVREVVRLTLFLRDHPEVSGLFNCGSGQARSWNELVKAVYAALGRDPNIEYIDMPEILRGKYQYYTRADMAKIHAAGYPDEGLSLEDGVRDYVQNYLLGEKSAV